MNRLIIRQNAHRLTITDNALRLTVRGNALRLTLSKQGPAGAAGGLTPGTYEDPLIIIDGGLL